MPSPSDSDPTVIVGAGLAGACAALVLSRTRRVVVLDPEPPASGASGAAAGLVNPFMGRNAHPAWRAGEALDALAELADEADGVVYSRSGLLRPAASPAQAEHFRAQVAHAGLRWRPAAEAAERWAAVAAPHGLLEVERGGSVDIEAFVQAALRRVRARGSEVRRERLVRWRPGSSGVIAITDRDAIPARALVLAPGDGARHLPPLSTLPLHRVKGQLVRLERPPTLPSTHPPVSGASYLVPRPDGVIAGSTFEHAFRSVAPDPDRDAGLLEAAVALMPGLRQARVLERRAGVRLTVPTTVSPRRLPLAGVLPQHPGVWVLAGLGAKGLLTAPLIARWLPAALDGHRPLPLELSGGVVRPGSSV